MSVTGLVSGCGTAHKSLLLLSRIKKFDFCTDKRDSALKVVFTDEVQMFSCSHVSALKPLENKLSSYVVVFLVSL